SAQPRRPVGGTLQRAVLDHPLASEHAPTKEDTDMSEVRATNRRSWMRRGLAAASGLALGASMVAVAAAANAAGCSVDYTVNSWGTGFPANVAITNLGRAIHGWTLEWAFPGNQQVTNLWNGTYPQ